MGRKTFAETLTFEDREAQRDNRRVQRVQELRRSNAAEPIPSRSRYNRNAFRKNAQRGNWEG